MVSFDYSSQAEALRAISHTPLFSGVGLPEQHMLADKCTIIDRPAEEIIIEQGDVGDRLYVIIKGIVVVSRKTPSEGYQRINTLTDGDVFGEIAVLHKVLRTARITTKTKCRFLTINGDDFIHIYEHFPAQSRDNIQLVIAKRLAQLNDTPWE